MILNCNKAENYGIRLFLKIRKQQLDLNKRFVIGFSFLFMRQKFARFSWHSDSAMHFLFFAANKKYWTLPQRNCVRLSRTFPFKTIFIRFKTVFNTVLRKSLLHRINTFQNILSIPDFFARLRFQMQSVKKC